MRRDEAARIAPRPDRFPGDGRAGALGRRRPCRASTTAGIEDRLINRVLLAGLRLAASVAADRCLRIKAERLADRLGETVAPIRLDRQVFRRLAGEMDRTTRPYEPAVSLIRILHEGGGLSLDDDEAGPSSARLPLRHEPILPGPPGEVPGRQPPRARRPIGAPTHGDDRLRPRLEPPPQPGPDASPGLRGVRRGRRPWRSWMRSIGTSGRTRCPGTCSTSLPSMR